MYKYQLLAEFLRTRVIFRRKKKQSYLWYLKKNPHIYGNNKKHIFVSNRKQHSLPTVFQKGGNSAKKKSVYNIN